MGEQGVPGGGCGGCARSAPLGGCPCVGPCRPRYDGDVQGAGPKKRGAPGRDSRNGTGGGHLGHSPARSLARAGRRRRARRFTAALARTHTGRNNQGRLGLAGWRGGGGGHRRAGGAQVKGKGWLPTFWVAGLRRGPRHVQSCPDLLALLGSGGAEPAAAAPVPTAEAGGGAAKAKVSAVGVLPRSASTHGLTADDAAATEEAQIRRRAAATYFRPPSARPPAVPPSSPRRREALGGRGSWRTQKSLILRL